MVCHIWKASPPALIIHFRHSQALLGDEQDTKVETCISMALFYENGKSSSKHPVGFEGRANGPISFVTAEGWETRAEMIPNLQFGTQM
jgi:hypothetical protein